VLRGLLEQAESVGVHHSERLRARILGLIEQA
jgi:hypothetical protein